MSPDELKFLKDALRIESEARISLSTKNAEQLTCIRLLLERGTWHHSSGCNSLSAGMQVQIIKGAPSPSTTSDCTCGIGSLLGRVMAVLQAAKS